ncbi:MAG: SDR family oxidoreductase [Lacinutrix sp.]|uniref:SDR family oxidoreductase n=1 Tax=Lacinutrix sp. TaxID=1937692 RepID=UPI0030A955AA
MKQLQGKTVLITGGASGIGKILARLFLEKQATVIIWDINEVSIAETISKFSSLGKIIGYTIDVSNGDQIQEIAQKVIQDFGSLDYLINNAGIIIGKYFYEHSTQDINKTIDINANAPMLITHAFLEGMLAKNSGHVCNIASSGGLISNPKMSVYVASKWALIGWSDSLRLEMKKLNKKIHVTTIMPYYINTGMFDGVNSKIPILKPEAAALTIFKAILKNKKMVTIPGYMYRFIKLGQAFMSINFFDWFAGSFLGIYSTMEKFTGREK